MLTPAYIGSSLDRQLSLLCTASGTDNGTRNETQKG